MQTIKDLIRIANAVVIDVRNDWEYQEGHIKGAIHIPLHELQVQIGRIKELKGPFVLYCRSGNRSGVAVNMLKKAGINNAHNGGGIFDMQKIILS